MAWIGIFFFWLVTISTHAATHKSVKPLPTPQPTATESSGIAAEPERPVPDIAKMLNLRADEVGDNRPIRVNRDEYRLDVSWYRYKRSISVMYYDNQWHHFDTYYKDPGPGDHFEQLDNVSGGCRTAEVYEKGWSFPSTRRVYCWQGPNAIQRGIIWPYGKVMNIQFSDDAVCIRGGPAYDPVVNCWKDGQEQAIGTFPNPRNIKKFFTGGGWSLSPHKNEICALYSDNKDLFCWSADKGLVQYSQFEDFELANDHVCFNENQPLRRRVCGIWDEELKTKSHFKATSVKILDPSFLATHPDPLPLTMACEFAGGYGCWGESNLFFLIDYIQENLSPTKIFPANTSVCYFSASEIGCLTEDHKKIETIYHEAVQPQGSVQALVNFDRTIAVLQDGHLEVQVNSSWSATGYHKTALDDQAFFSRRKIIGIRQGIGRELCVQDQLEDVVRESCADPTNPWYKISLHVISPTSDQLQNVIENEYVACGDYQNTQLCWSKKESDFTSKLLNMIDQMGRIRYLASTGPKANRRDACVANRDSLKCVDAYWGNQISSVYGMFNIDDALCVAAERGVSCWGTPAAANLGRFLPQNLDFGLKALGDISPGVKSKFYVAMAKFVQDNVPRDQFLARYHLLARVHQLVGATGHSALETNFTSEIERDLQRADTLRPQFVEQDPPEIREELLVSCKILQESLSVILAFTSEADDLASLYPALGSLFANPSTASATSVVEQLDGKREHLTQLETLSKIYPLIQTVKTEHEWLRQHIH